MRRWGSGAGEVLSLHPVDGGAGAGDRIDRSSGGGKARATRSRERKGPPRGARKEPARATHVKYGGYSKKSGNSNPSAMLESEDRARRGCRAKRATTRGVMRRGDLGELFVMKQVCLC